MLCNSSDADTSTRKKKTLLVAVYIPSAHTAESSSDCFRREEHDFDYSVVVCFCGRERFASLFGKSEQESCVAKRNVNGREERKRKNRLVTCFVTYVFE